MEKIKLIVIAISIAFCGTLQAQVTIGSNAAPDNNALLDLKQTGTTTKGLLLPRVALTGTANAAPLTAHVAGMAVYNTATTGDVAPGHYCNDGTKWVRMITDASEPWFVSGTSSTQATLNTQNIYTKGNVAIGSSIGNNSTKLLIREESATNSVSSMRVESIMSAGGYQWFNIYSNLGQGSFSNLVRGGDFGLIFSQDNNANVFSSSNGFVITPHMNGHSGGLKIFDNGAVSINSAIAKEYFTVGGNMQVVDLPTNGTDSIYNGNFNTTNPTKKSTKFTATRTVVADANGVLGTVAGVPTASSAWGLTGNAETTAGTNFLGTTDDQDLVFKRGGIQAGLLNSSKENTFFGVQARSNANDAGKWNTAVGFRTLSNNTTGNGNTAVGRTALAWNTTGLYNVAVGHGALERNTEGSGNTAVGSAAMGNNTTGWSSVAMGRSALNANTSGVYNVAVGETALYSNTTGGDNTAMGQSALYKNTEGANNTAVGRGTLYENKTGGSNTSIGHNALRNNLTGTNNTAVGAAAGLTATGSNNIVIGAGQNLPVNDGSTDGNNQLNIGGTIFGTGMPNAGEEAKGRIGINTTTPTATLHTNGSFATNIVQTDSDPYTAKDNDYTIIANHNVVLPAAAADNKGRIYWVRIGAAGNVNVTVSGGSIVNLGSSGSGTLSPGGGGNRAYMLQSDGSNWYIIMRY